MPPPLISHCLKPTHMNILSCKGGLEIQTLFQAAMYRVNKEGGMDIKGQLATIIVGCLCYHKENMPRKITDLKR